MITRLPYWILTEKYPAFSETESKTAVEMTSRVYGKMQELVDDYNSFVNKINLHIEEYETGVNTDFDTFKNDITKTIHDYILTIDMKIQHQDRQIVEIYENISSNLNGVIETIVNEMKENGEFEEIIGNAFDSLGGRIITLENAFNEMVARVDTIEEKVSYLENESTLFFDNVASMKNATLKLGDIVKTLGFYLPNDGGGAFYKIVEKTQENEMTVLSVNNNLSAELIFDKPVVNAKKLGLKQDKVTDETTLLQNIVDFCYLNDFELLLTGYVYVTRPIETKGIKIRGLGDPAKASSTYNFSQYGAIGYDYIRNTGNGALITFTDYAREVLVTGSGVISDIANPILKCDHINGKFNLENICVCGWIRTTNQEGLLSTNSSSDTYINGRHKFKKVSVINCGGNGIHLNSLELTNPEELYVGYNMGYGLFIEGITGKDTPFEYVKIRNSEFVGNKLGGIYAYKSFRKGVEIEKCDFSRNGLYKELNITPTSTITSLASGCKIESWNPYLNSNQNNFTFKDNYGEEVELLLSILTYEYGHVFNAIDVHNNIHYPITPNETNCLFYLDNDYCKYFSFYNNTSTSNKMKLSTSVRQLIAQTIDENYYENFNLTKNVTLNSKLTPGLVEVYQYGNLVEMLITATVNAQLSQWEKIITKLPLPVREIYPGMSVNGEAKGVTIDVSGNLFIQNTIPSGASITISYMYFAKPYSERS